MLTTKVHVGWVIFRSIGFISFLIHLTPKSIVFKRFSNPSFLRIAFAVREFRQNACKINQIQRKNNCFELQAWHQTKRRHAFESVLFDWGGAQNLPWVGSWALELILSMRYYEGNHIYL